MRRLPRRAAATAGAAALAMLAGCAAPQPMQPMQPLRDAALLQALQGAWCNSDDGGASCWAWDQFFADGTLRACGRQPDEREPFSGRGAVTVEGDRMCYRVTRATANFWVRPGSVYCTRIVAIGASSHVYEDLDGGRRHTLLRVPASRVDCAPD